MEAICVLNQQRVFEDMYNIRRDGALYALCMDQWDLKMYTYQKQKVWIYVPFNETRSVIHVVAHYMMDLPILPPIKFKHANGEGLEPRLV